MLNQVSIPVSKSQEPIVKIINGQAVASSLDVAKFFGKRHKNVSREIDELFELEPDFCRLNFEPTIYLVPQPKGGTREVKAYNMSRDGFTMLAMGFTGAKARKFKIAYIQAYNNMEAYIKGLPVNGQMPLFPASQPDAPLTQNQRNQLHFLASAWACYASLGASSAAWRITHKHFGVKSIKDYKASQYLEIARWMSERVYIKLRTRGYESFEFDILDPRPLLANICMDDETVSNRKAIN